MGFMLSEGGKAPILGCWRSFYFYFFLLAYFPCFLSLSLLSCWLV
jgi:hypothetical protein